MINEKYIVLMEKYLSNDISKEEKKELKDFMNSDSELKTEFEEQKKIKEVLNKMKLKNR